MTEDLRKFVDGLKVAALTLSNGEKVYGEIVNIEGGVTTLKGVLTISHECDCCLIPYHLKCFTGHVNFPNTSILSTCFADFQLKYFYSREILRLKVEEILAEDALAAQAATMPKVKAEEFTTPTPKKKEPTVWKNYRNGSAGGFSTC